MELSSNDTKSLEESKSKNLLNPKYNDKLPNFNLKQFKERMLDSIM